jgi:hypothetical protein
MSWSWSWSWPPGTGRRRAGVGPQGSQPDGISRAVLAAAMPVNAAVTDWASQTLTL